MKDTKKTILFACAFVLAAVVIPFTVYAYLQSEPKQQNKFSVGEGKNVVSEVFSKPEALHMSDTFTKEVAVNNNGTSDQFVRVYLDFSDSRVRNSSKIVYTKNNAEQEKSWSEFLADLPEDWTYISEESDTVLGGYFYYTKILKQGETTPPLIKGVKTNFGNDGNIDRITDFDIIVYSESVQTVDIDSSGTVYSDANYNTAWISFLTH